LAQNYPICGTEGSTEEEMRQKPWYYDNGYLDIIEAAKEKMFNSSNAKRMKSTVSSIMNPVSVPIKFWIYEDAANSTPVPNDRELQRLVDRTNFLFQSNGMDFRFYTRCTEIIDNPDALDVEIGKEARNILGKERQEENAINVHIVEILDFAAGVYSYYPGGEFIAIRQAVVFNRIQLTTLAHEIGHYFNLDHTHQFSDEGDEKGKCRSEAINRNTFFAFNELLFCPTIYGPKFGRVCEKNGDAICDTPADPDFSVNGIAGGKIVANCMYNNPAGPEMDAWDDVYTENNVDTRNLMSSADPDCRDLFSRGQTNVMWHNIMFKKKKEFILDLDEEHMNPDQYEPDDSDFAGVPRLISMGETQFHSFHGFEDCADEVDWLRIDNSNGQIGSYVVEVNNVEGFENAVAEVNIYNTDAAGNRTSKLSEITGGSGSIQISCNTSTNDFLIEILKEDDPNDEVVQSIYTISLSYKYELLNLPANATVNWSSSNGTSIQVNPDQSVFVDPINGLTEYWIRAVVNSNGCQKEIKKVFESANGNSLQAFQIVEVFPACSPANSVLDYGIYKTVPSIEVNWNVSSGNIFGSSTGTSISVNPGFGNFTLIATDVTECGDDYAVSKTFFADECNCPINLNVTNNANKTIDVEVINQSQNFRFSGTHQIVVTNSNYEMIEEMETNNNIISINTNGYSDGIYYIHVYTDDCYEAKKVFVNEADNCNTTCNCIANISEAQLDNKTFRVGQKIISNSFNNAKVTYVAGESILLETGFETHSYFNFEAKIEDCP